MMTRLALATFWCALAAPALQAQDAERYDLRAPLDSARTQVLVLGTNHLATLGDDFDPMLVAPLLVAVEQLPGRD